MAQVVQGHTQVRQYQEALEGHLLLAAFLCLGEAAVGLGITSRILTLALTDKDNPEVVKTVATRAVIVHVGGVIEDLVRLVVLAVTTAVVPDITETDHILLAEEEVQQDMEMVAAEVGVEEMVE